LLVHDKSRATRKLSFLIQNSVSLRNFARHVAKQREFDSDLFAECGVRRGSVNADAKYGGVLEVDLAGVDTRLVSLKFFRSTTGEYSLVQVLSGVRFSEGNNTRDTCRIHERSC
jgi:hypothetical protein